MTFVQETTVQALIESSHHKSLNEKSHMGVAFELYQINVDIRCKARSICAELG